MGIFWSFGDQIAIQGIQFILQIILARLLLPEDFGIYGMILVFIAISYTIIDSGITQALIREQNTSQVDYSTAFYFSLIMSFVMYGVLYAFAPAISEFFDEPQLVLILRILSLVLIISSLGNIQRAQLTKAINFKTQTKINFIAGILSGVTAIIFAVQGFGVWSLIVKILSMQLFQSGLLWIYIDWKPTFVFKYASFKKLFGFGSKIMLASLITTIYSNIYYILIGRFYSAAQLGYYTNAVKLNDVASQTITAALQRVTYPVLSSIQDEEERLKYGFKKIIRTSTFLNFPLMVGLAVIAEPLINMLFGNNWLPMVVYFQLLCFAGMLYPLNAINLNILQVKGNSNLYLQLIIAKQVALTLLIFGAVWFDLGVIGLIGVAVIQSYIELILNSHFAGREISYSTIELIKDIFLIYIITLLMGGTVYLCGMFLPVNNFLKIILQILVGTVVYIGMSKLAKIQELNIVIDFISTIIKRVSARKNGSVINNKM